MPTQAAEANRDDERRSGGLARPVTPADSRPVPVLEYGKNAPPPSPRRVFVGLCAAGAGLFAVPAWLRMSLAGKALIFDTFARDVPVLIFQIAVIGSIATTLTVAALKWTYDAFRRPPDAN